MSEELLRQWENLTQERVYWSWYNSSFSIFHVFYDYPSLYDTTPLKHLLDDYMKDKKLHRKVSIGITDGTNVEAVTYDIDEFPNENITQLIMYSTAMPFFFPYYVHNNTSLYIDGGVLLNVNVHSAVRRCKEFGVKEEDIIIDAILPTGFQIDKELASLNYTGYDMLERYLQIVRYKAALDDIVHAFFDFKNVTFRYIVMPSEDLPSGQIPLDFDHDMMMQMIDMGKKDAKHAIDNKDAIWENILKRKGGKVVKYSQEQHEEKKINFLEKF